MCESRIPSFFYGRSTMTEELAARKRRLKFRASHRGTKEADIMIGSFCDAHVDTWGETEILWFEALLEEQDVDIMAWAIGREEAPARYHGPLLDAFCRLDFMVPPK